MPYPGKYAYINISFPKGMQNLKYFKETKSFVEFRIPYRNVSIPLAPVVEEVPAPEHLHEVEAVLDTGAVVQGHQSPPSHVRIRAWSGEAVAMIGTLQILWSPN